MCRWHTYPKGPATPQLRAYGKLIPFGKTAREYYDDCCILGRGADQLRMQSAHRVMYADRERRIQEILSPSRV